MSVIVGRALPDVRDGLKPVHRRILWSMFEQGLRPDRPYRKSANVVGGVMKQVPPARRPRDLRRVGPDGAGLLAARTAGRRARELRLGRRRPARGPALHGGAARADRARAAPRHRGRDGRLRPELRRLRAAAGRAPGALPEPARQRFGGDRRRDGDEHPAAQPRRGDRRGRALHRPPRVHAEGPDEVRQGSGLPDRRDRSWAATASRTPTRPAGARSRSVPSRRSRRPPTAASGSW